MREMRQATVDCDAKGSRVEVAVHAAAGGLVGVGGAAGRRAAAELAADVARTDRQGRQLPRGARAAAAAPHSGEVTGVQDLGFKLSPDANFLSSSPFATTAPAELCIVGVAVMGFRVAGHEVRSGDSYAIFRKRAATAANIVTSLQSCAF